MESIENIKRAQRRYGLGLRWQVLLVLSVVLFIAVVLVGLIVLHVNQRNLIVQKVRSGVTLSTIIARTLAATLSPEEPLDSPNNRARLRRAAQRVALRDAQDSPTPLNPSVIDQVVVIDPQMQVIASSPPSPTQDLGPGVEVAYVLGERAPFWTIERVSGQGRMLLVLAPLYREKGPTIGAVGLRIPLRDVDEQIQSSQRLLLLYIGLDAILLLIVGYLLMTRLIVRPIRAIEQATRRVAQGDYSSPVKVRTSNEFSRLADDFNAMIRQLREQRESLEQKVAQLEVANQNLAQAQHSLIRSEKLATVGRLSAGIAHEVGNPLSAVLGYIELLRDPDMDLEDDERSDLLVRVQRELRRIDDIIRDLLDYARAEKDKPTACPLGPIIETSFHLVQTQPRARGLELRTELPPDLPLAFVHEGRMQQVLVNLLLNAADALVEQSARAEHRAAFQGTIVVRAFAHPTKHTRICLEVEDNGPGIPSEILADIFEPFFTTKDPGKGTGLGLAICQSIIASLNGTLEVRSESGQGTTFVIQIPGLSDTMPPTG